MSSIVTFNGVNYTVPATGDTGWGNNVSSYLIAIASGALQKTGGSFLLSAETDFGAAFGLKSLYYKSRSANISSVGILRLANNSDSISWRNAANSADLSLLVNASNQLTFNGAVVPDDANVVHISGSQTITGQKTFSLPILESNGTVSLPSYSFSANPATGMYQVAGNDIGFSISGTLSARLNSSGNWSVSDGLQTAPSLSFISDPDTGIYHIGDNNIGIATNGTKVLDITTNKLGINTTPVKVLDVRGATDGLVLIAPSDDVAPTADIFQVTNAALSNVFQIAKSGTVHTSLGTAALPAYSFLGDTNTGIYSSTADTVNISTGGTERLRIDGSQVFLFNDGSAATPTFSWQSDSDIGLYRGGTNILSLATAGLQRLTLDASGNVQVGPGTANNTQISTLQFTTDSAGSRYAGIRGFRGADAANIDLRFFTIAGDTGGILERMRIQNDGLIGIGTTAPKTILHTVGAGTSAPATTGTTPGTGTVIRVKGNSNAVLDLGSNSTTYAWIQSYDATGMNTNYPLWLNPNGGAVSIFGTATNDSASAGFVGEEIRSQSTSAANITTTTTYQNFTSISLTAGDWDVTGQVKVSGNGATWTGYAMAVSINTGNTTTDHVTGDNVWTESTGGSYQTNETFGMTIATYRLSLSATTTVYLKGRATFSAGTPQILAGRISARRMR